MTGVYFAAIWQANSMLFAAILLSTVIDIPGTFSVSAGRSKDGSNDATLYEVTLATTLLMGKGS